MKITDKKRKEALEIAKMFGCKELFVNVDGEFFTNQNYAANSVKNDKELWAKVDLGVEAEVQKVTNDLGKSADVIAAIEAATSSAEVIAILDAEAEGKNRKSVIEAGNKKLAAIANAATSPGAEDREAATA